MKTRKTVAITFIFIALFLFGNQCIAQKKLNIVSPCTLSTNSWSKEKANAWYTAQPWISGCNFQPSTAINSIEMWQSESFDLATINKELGWAEELGFKVVRVFLNSVVWKDNPTVFKRNINQYLTVATNHGIRTIFVFFDDCFNKESNIGKQPDPIPGIILSGWIQDPSCSLRNDTTKLFPILKLYVKDILKTYINDTRIYMWDLYNEPGNSSHGISSLPLLKNVYKWAREVNPSQPISAGIWYFDCVELNNFQLENSDIITYHTYTNEVEHQKLINKLKLLGRPMICTEYMARPLNSHFDNIMPLLKSNNIGAINWGFVYGKTNAIFAWSEPIASGKEPLVWFHDIYRNDKTAFDVKEIELIKNLNGVK